MRVHDRSIEGKREHARPHARGREKEGREEREDGTAQVRRGGKRGGGRRYRVTTT